MNIYSYGLKKEMTQGYTKGIPARITAVHRERYELVCDRGECFGRLKTKEYYGGTEMFPTVGDFVMINFIETGDSQIISTLPRCTSFSRRDPHRGMGEQAVAANFDYVFIMQSLNMNFNPKRLERYLTLALQSGAVPVIVLTKADLADDIGKYVCAAEKVAIGVDIHVISVKSGVGLDAIKGYVSKGKTVVFLGSSGVGKSSLANAIAGEEVMSVSGIREQDSRGRHTTTHRQLIMLKNGGMIIDTPGMRELGMLDVIEGLDEAFSDVESFIGKCRFNDCSHTSEPGCAVRAAIESGELDRSRWESYCALKAEAKYADSETRGREKQKWSKEVSKYKRNKKKEIW